ncbi:hypothetical protein CEXT_101661 [Caerostris extrusa]|uniref:Uncharacterized protein n=1 Tax=Caerostris extrusa TaxID=172846 RepID=A0AAV4NBW8_CAEEX|nr:hypothetical protein CEXT_101661 [Caerostris extrusa]
MNKNSMNSDGGCNLVESRESDGPRVAAAAKKRERRRRRAWQGTGSATCRIALQHPKRKMLAGGPGGL